MRSARPLWLLLGTALLAAAVYVYTTEWVEVTTDGGPSPEAWRNPYLAADEYLGRLGVDTQRHDRLTELVADLAAVDALVMTGSRATLSDATVGDLLDWVLDGGHLLALADSEYDPNQGASHDPLLDQLDVRLLRGEEAEEMSEATERFLGVVLDPDVLCQPEPSGVVNVGGTPLRVQLASDRHLSYEGGGVVALGFNAAGEQLLQLEYGRGLVTVVTSTRQWRNNWIGCFDHAHLLGVLLGDAATVRWVSSIEMPGLLTLIWEHFHYALIGLLTSVLLWVWRRGFRFGAVRETTAEARRSALEHVRAVAAHYWHGNQASALLEFLRDDVLRRVGGGTDTPALAAAATMAEVSAAEIEHAFGTAAGASRDDFVAAVKVLQRLRKVL